MAMLINYLCIARLKVKGGILNREVTQQVSEDPEEDIISELFDQLAALGRRIRSGLDKERVGSVDLRETNRSPTMAKTMTRQ